VLKEMVENQSEENYSVKIRGIRHEINNALTTVRGQTQLLLMRGRLDAAERMRVERIEEQAKRIQELVEELKDI
jgi:signal transduction histidine kinase